MYVMYVCYVFILCWGAEEEDTGNTIPCFPPVAPYPTGVTSASRRGLALREWNKTCTLALKTKQKCTNNVDKTTFPTQINAKYVIYSQNSTIFECFVHVFCGVLFGDHTVCTAPIPRHTRRKHMLAGSVLIRET